MSPTAGLLAGRLGRRRLLIWVTVGVIVLGCVYTVFLMPQDSEELTRTMVQTFLILGKETKNVDMDASSSQPAPAVAGEMSSAASGFVSGY